ncbi:tetratricopeptide repeat protein [Flavobacterium sp. 102]|uniref:tetratricopeptide repeat-containing sensor histidine kinase n=1 Tax=Flavobacterium sp. 102 TaxID=2135623 RepID=UPI000EAF2655|nr:tetratricopeptide repeat protein [Flavobacterium sp. 102]RKS03513.1 tetratricopeptide repeat protein [Flavobacterium sp. 102]
MKTILKLTILFNCIIYSSISHSQNTTIDSLKKVIRITKIDTSKVNIYNQLSFEFKESNLDSAFFYAQKAVNLSEKIKYNNGLANGYINQGNTNIILGNYKEARNAFEKAKNTFEKLLKDDEKNKSIKNGLARSYASLGVIFSQESNYYAALENYQKALHIYQEIDQKNSVSKAYNNIGVVYKSQGNKIKALEYFEKALKIQKEIGEPTVPVTLTNIGVIHFEQNNLTKAISYYNQAEKIFKYSDNLRGYALLNNYLGDYYKKQNNLAKAIVYYNQALTMYESLQNKFGASLALYNLGQLYYEQNQYDESMNFATKSLAYAKEIGVLDQIFHSEKLVSELYDKMNNPAESLAHYKNYIVARDSITNLENNKKFVQAEMDFEYKKREALLAEESKRQTQFLIFSALGIVFLIGFIFLIYNRGQVKKRLTLQKEVAEYEQKALHLQMNPHFVFNCLGSISSFIVQNGTDSALKYLSKFSKLMRLTLEYSKGSLIPIDKEIESLQNYLELEQLRFHNKFDFDIRSSEKVEFNMGLPPLLIQPFVENAILHGLVPKENKGKIEVVFDVENGQLICTITDDGIGISKSKQMKENSMQAHKSMALEITKKRLEIMEATILKSAQIDIREIEKNNEITGTKVTLRLPVQYIQ